jgi:outer membrane receptor for ferrienterochelin and colicins
MANGNLAFLAAGLILCSGASLSAQEKSLDELLDLKTSDLLNLEVVSALKRPESIGRVPATVRVITAEDIRDNGYFTLEDALADLPGLQFRNIEGFNSYIFVRGAPGQNNKVLLLVDGVQINELNSGGFYAGGQYNLTNVERIEVVYGPASALYGTNAVSGVISVFTRNPKDSQGGRVSVQAGSFGARAIDFRYARYDEKKDAGFSVSAMYKQNGKADLKGSAGDFNWTDSMDNFENDVAMDARFQRKSLSAGIVLQDKNASYATFQVTAPQPGLPSLSDHGVNWRIRFVNAWAAYTYDKPKTWSLRSTLYYRNSTVPDDTLPVIEFPSETSPGRQFRYYRPNHAFGNESQLRWSPGKRWRVSVGLVLEQERLARNIAISESDSASERPPAPPAPDMMTNRLLGVYAQGQVALTRELDLFVGVRHDHSSYYGDVTTPQTGLVLNRGRLNAKLLYMRAYRAPKPWDYTNGLGNPDLRPEKNGSLEASGGWAFSSHLRFELSVYHNRFSNLLSRDDVGDSWRWINAGSLTTDGCEPGLEYRRGRVKAYGNYTYTRSLDAQDRQVAEIAPHGGNAGITYAFTRNLRLSVRGQYLGVRSNPKIIPTTGNNRIDDAFVLHSALSLGLPRGFDLQLVGDNLLDAVYYHPSNLQPSRYRQPQRVFRLSLGYSF